MHIKRHEPRPFYQADCIDLAHPGRSEVEGFIRRIYSARFDARPSTLMPHLLAFRDVDGQLVAAVGLRCALQGPLFAERYLDLPAERALQARLGFAPPRAQLVEIGNFAAATPGAARALILTMIPLLHGAGLRWPLFAATRALRNAFARLGLDPQHLAPARAEALGAESELWGHYYASDPAVLFGDLEQAHAALRHGGRGSALPDAAPPELAPDCSALA